MSILERRRCKAIVSRVGVVLDEFHGRAKRRAPLLIGMRVDAASAVRAPALDSMRAAPGAARGHREDAPRRMRCEVVGAIRDDHVVAPLEHDERARKLGCALLLVMTECLAVGGYHDRLAGFERKRAFGDTLEIGR